MRMSFIGVLSDNKTFENIKSKILENSESNKMNILSINLKSIENIRNIKFECIIIDCELEKFKDYYNTLEKLYQNAKFIILNTDYNKKYNTLKKSNKNIITYGLNHKADITVSSITDNDILIYIQKNIENIKENVIEIQEKRIEKKGETNLKIYEILIIYSIFLLYNEKIISEI